MPQVLYFECLCSELFSLCSVGVLGPGRGDSTYLLLGWCCPQSVEGGLYFSFLELCRLNLLGSLDLLPHDAATELSMQPFDSRTEPCLGDTALRGSLAPPYHLTKQEGNKKKSASLGTPISSSGWTWPPQGRSKTPSSDQDPHRPNAQLPCAIKLIRWV